MSEVVAPAPQSSSLAPPSLSGHPSSRPSSAASDRSGSSRRGRSRGSSNVSRTNSVSSHGSGVKRSGATTTISGGTSLGPSKEGNPPEAPVLRPSSAASKGSTGRRNGGRSTSTPSPKPGLMGPPPPPVPRVLHAVPQAPKTALEAAMEAAGQKGGNEALVNLQKMISDLKSIPAGASPVDGGSKSSNSSGRRESNARDGQRSESVKIPAATGSQQQHQLKADAPSFTPSLQTFSPPVSQASLSPIPSLTALPHPRSMSTGSAPRRSSNGAVIQAPGGPFLQHLTSHPEMEDEVLPFNIGFQQQQLLAAQQYQFQQIQILQAQIAANQLAQQSQQQMGSFTAPRFQALAAQRQAAQQQAQVQQLAQATQIYELQQQQLQAVQTAASVQENARQNPPPVFEEDSPEKPNIPLGPTGRPQLAPSFTFGAKRENGPVINRQEGIGGAAATGLAGLAARAHKRTGSEISPAMQQQLDIQEQIEALQAKQKALMAEDLGATPLASFKSPSQPPPSQTLTRHRRVQSTMPSNEQAVPEPTISERQGAQPQDPMGHNRRHSVNVFKKSAGAGSGFGSISNISELDELIGGGMGHSRSGSRSFESGNWRSNGNGGAIGGGVSDLASAQAQLQSLAQFRAAAGGGHAKMASFSFPNMLPNLLAATTLQSPGGQSLWQQQQAFQMQLQQNSAGPQRKNLFAPYLPQASLPPLLQAGKLVVGVLRVNKKNRSDAYVATDVLDADIYICGSKDRNRALEGDIVAVELLDVDEVWTTKKDKEEKKKRKEENASYDFKPNKKVEKRKDDVEVEGQGLTLFDDEEVNDETKPTFAGHVVAVVERMPGQLFSGQLGVLRPSSAATKERQENERQYRGLGDKAHTDESRPKIVWFKPTDKRVPLIAIPTEQAPADFLEKPDVYVDRLFVATIKRWPITSLHPFGTLVEELGTIGDAEVETSALLKDSNFPTEEFSDLSLKCLPPLPWAIPEREYEVRTDLREERVFTIDPPTATDLDDALSCRQNPDGTFTVGVHIADVAFFVKPNTAVDREARKRATSVYLVQRSVPMLPPQLSEQLCSLVPGVERLAFSAIFTLDRDARVLEQKFERTIIKSCAKLAYADALDVIEGGGLSKDKGGAGKEIEDDIRRLTVLASKLRAHRTEAGAMTSEKLKVRFRLNDKNKPVDCFAERKTAANMLVEEFTLLTNLTVARIIAHGLQDQALLRRHEAPVERRIEGFVKRAAKLGYNFDSTDAASIQKGFDAVRDQDVSLCLELLKRRAMFGARYFCTGMLDIAKYGHWALNVPLYTHFTSPIRRYADVLVHRMLDACITAPNKDDVKFLMDRDQVAKCAQQCNMKKASAKLAEDQSIHLYLCLLIHDLTEKYGPVIREGRVTGVLDAAFDVVIPEFGIEKRVHVDKMPVEHTVFDEHRDILSLYWTGEPTLSFLARTTDDPHHLKIQSISSRPASPMPSPKPMDETASSKQYAKSAARQQPKFTGLREREGHKIQDIKELMCLPVIVTSDLTKSPPVLVIYACNPYAKD